MLLPNLMIFTFGPLSVLGHGNMVWPPTWFGPDEPIGFKPNDLDEGNDYDKSPIMWFSNWTFIPGVATLDPSLYTLPDFHGDDYHFVENIYPTTPDRNPWMAPGTARVFSPCGVAGGNPFGMSSTNFEVDHDGAGFSYGTDARDINWKDAALTEWQRGEKAEVGWGIWANHGGGYSYRLCKVGEDGPGGVTEDCFQKTPLKFASVNSWVQNGTDETTRVVFKANRTTEGTYPGESQWTMNPIPLCKNPMVGDCPEGPLEFPARVKGLQGLLPFLSFTNNTLIDEVKVPEDLEPGKYVLSFRWDCEATPQIWNACSNILIV